MFLRYLCYIAVWYWIIQRVSILYINNVNFNVEVKGSGTPLIWGHGLTSSITSENLLQLYHWEQFPESHTLIRYDARGHGKTDPAFSPMDYHWNNLSQDMISIVDECVGGNFIAGGQSMGSATAIYTALQVPERVKGLVLMNPPTAWKEREEQASFYQKMSRMGMLFGGEMMAGMMTNKLDRLLPHWLVNVDEINAVGALDGLKAVNRMSLYNLFKGAALTDLPSKEQLESIEAPTLILAWKDDPSHPLSVAEELHSRLKNSKLVVACDYDGVKKWPKLIREFVGSISSS